MKLHVLRHGITKYNELGKTNGQTIEDPLSEKGIEQAHELVKSLPSRIDAIYSSDLLRARQTALIIAQHVKMDVNYVPELREINLGSLTGLSWKEINAKVGRDILSEYIAQKYDFTPWGGEKFDDMKERVTRFINETKSKCPDNDILVVTHGGVVRFLEYLFNNKVGQPVISNLGIAEFEVK